MAARKMEWDGSCSNSSDISLLFKNVRCPRCSASYKFKDVKNTGLTHFPVLLSCGHGACEMCVRKSPYTCTICNQITEVQKGQLPKHLYILGLVTAGRNELVYMKFNPAQTLTMQGKPTKNKDACQECNRATAAVMCKKCTSHLCHQCFKKIHNHRTMRLHEPKPINSVEGFSQLPKCLEHPDVTVTHLCRTCSVKDKETLFCTRCWLLGVHQQHEIIEITRLTAHYLPEIEKIMQDLVEVIDVLDSSKRKCRDLIGNVLNGCNEVVSDIRAYTHRLHGLLQHQELSAINTVHSLTNDFSKTLTNYEIKLEQEITKRKTLLTAAESIIHGDSPVAHPEVVMSELNKLVTAYPLLKDMNENDNLFSFKVMDGLEDSIAKCIDFGQIHDRFQLLSCLELSVMDQVTRKSSDKVPTKSDMYRNYQLSNVSNTGVSIDSICQVGISNLMATTAKESDEITNNHRFSPISNQKSLGSSSETLMQVNGNFREIGWSDKRTSIETSDAQVTFLREINSCGIPNEEINSTGENFFCDTHLGQFESSFPVCSNKFSSLKLTNDFLNPEMESQASCISEEKTNSQQLQFENKLNVQCYNDDEDCTLNIESVMSTDIQLQAEQFSSLRLAPSDTSTKLSEDSFIFSPSLKHSENIDLQVPDTVECVNIPKDWDLLGARPKLPAFAPLPSTQEFGKELDLSTLKRSVSAVSLQSSSSSVTSSLLPSKLSALFMEEDVEVTHIHNPSFFYVQRKIDCDKLKKLFRMINTKPKKKLPQNLIPSVGMVYLGQFTHDSNWYRALVTSVKPDACEVLVHYIDYGNNELLKISQLRECPTEYHLENVPAFALPCGLWEIKPSRGEIWDTEAVKVFAELITNVTLQLFIMEYEKGNNSIKCNVELRRPWKTSGITNDLPLSIREVLIFLEYAVYINKSPKDMYEKNHVAAYQQCYFCIEVPFGKDSTPVVLSNVVSPHRFSLQLESTAWDLNGLMSALQKHYNSPKVSATLDWCIYAPKIGMPCVARYSGDGKWYRARIQDLPGKCQVDVQYVDFGNEERMWYKQIFKIMDKFLKLPAQAITCSLCDVIPVGDHWTDSVVEQMTSVCEFRDLEAIFHNCEEEVCKVSLLACTLEEKIDVGEYLIDHGVAVLSELKNKKIYKELDCGLDPLNFEMPLRQKIINSRRLLCELPQKKSRILVQDVSSAQHKYLEVKYLAVLYPLGYIHLQLTSLNSSFKQLESKLEEVKNEIQMVQRFAPNFGELCLLKTRHTPHYARAKILKLENDQAEVLLVDHGGIMKASISCLYPLPNTLQDLRHLGMVVCLMGLVAPGGHKHWPSTSLDYIKEQLTNHSNLYIFRKGCSYHDCELDLNILPVELGWMQEIVDVPFEASTVFHISLNDLLTESGLALPVRALNSPLQKKEINPKNDNHDSVGPANADCISVKYENEPWTPQDVENFMMHLTLDKDTASYSNCNTNNTDVICWIPCPLPETTTFMATPTYVDDQGIIYLHPVANKRTLELIRESQTMQFEGSTPTDDDLCWAPGDPVIAQFHLDKKWYRATVNKLNENGEVEVHFVDYGNTENVTLQELRTNIIYPHLPIQCYKCALHNLFPISEDGQWQEKTLKFLHKSVVEKVCLVTVMEEPCLGGVLKINLELVDVGIDVASLLADKLKICWRVIPCTTIDEQSSVDVVIESDSSLGTVCSLAALPTVPLPSSPSAMFCVEVTAIRDPAHVYIVPVVYHTIPQDYLLALSSYYSEYDSFLKYVNTNITEFPVISNLEIGEIYLGKFITGHWYRIQVQKLNATTAIVLYVDFGNLETIPKNNIRSCPAHGKSIASRAVGVKLYEVMSPQGPEAGWSEAAMEGMIACLMGPNTNKFFASIMEPGNPPQVQIFNMEASGTCTLAYLELVEKGIISLTQTRKE